MQLEKAASEEREEAQVALDKAKARVDKYKGRVEDKQLAEKPKVEVRSRKMIYSSLLYGLPHPLSSLVFRLPQKWHMPLGVMHY